MKINIGYSVKSIDKAIKQIEEYQKRLENLIPNFLEECADRIIERANSNIGIYEYDSDIITEIQIGWDKKRDGNVLTLSNKSQKATYIEFGVGQVGKGTHKAADDAGYEYDINNHGSKGWGFYLDEGEPLDLRQPYYKDFFKGDKFWIWTNGSPSTMFLFNAMMDFIDNKEFLPIIESLLKGL